MGTQYCLTAGHGRKIGIKIMRSSASSLHSKMFKLTVLFVLAAVVFGGPFDEPIVPMLDGRIVGGQEVNITDHPHQISLTLHGFHLCGGSIIGKKHVVTAAHCTEIFDVADLSIRAGSDTRDEGGIIIQVAKLFQHPNYNPHTADNDISVLELAKELTFSSSIAPIGLPAPNQQVKPGTQVTTTGWGDLKENGTASIKLQGVTVPVVTQEDCRKAYGQDKITDSMLCAGLIEEGGKDSCQGDSGGPLIAGKVLHGVVSWGYGCARPKYPGVYANVANLRNFIKQTSGI